MQKTTSEIATRIGETIDSRGERHCRQTSATNIEKDSQQLNLKQLEAQSRGTKFNEN